MRLAAALASLTLASLAAAQSGGELLWEYTLSTAGGSIAHGQRGTLAFSRNGFTGVRLDSMFELAPPAPVWISDSIPLGRLAAAEEADDFLFTTLNILGYASSETILHKLSSDSPGDDWTFAFPVQFLSYPGYDLSDDGQTIVSAFTDESTAQLPFDIKLHDPATGSPTSVWSGALPDRAERIDLSPDGTHLAYSSDDGQGQTHLLDLSSGQVVFSAPGSLLPSGPTLSSGGLVFATGEHVPGAARHARVYAFENGTWALRVEVSSPEDISPDIGAVSADGSVVAIGWTNFADYESRLLLRAYDVASGAQTMQRAFDTLGNLSNRWTDIDIAADGSLFAVSMYGDQPGSLSELSVYAPDSPVPVADFPAGRTVEQVDLSADGRHLLATRANGHVNAGYTGKIVQAYRIGEPDLRVVGKPSIGGTSVVEFEATPGSSAFLLVSTGQAQDPIDQAGIGTLQLDRSMLGITPIGPVPAWGTVSVALAIPADPNLIGLERFYQGYSTGPALLTTDFASVLVLP